MRRSQMIVVVLLSLAVCASAQTADELIAKNLAAKGGLEKIRAIQTVRMTGTQDNGGFKAAVTQENKRPNQVRETFSLQGMTGIQAYDGSAGWAVRPFGGKKDPVLLGEDDLHGLLLDADLDGPLTDYKAKGNTVEYLGMDTVDGDDAYKLKVTLKNGDIIYYYLDPDTYLEIREEFQMFIRGSVREFAQELGSYKPVAGVMFPFSIANGPKNNPDNWSTITYDQIEVNVPLSEADFAVPASLQAPATKKP
ncbi:MAG TPA: hypothetical protein VEG08_13295 [Terriglobales bacterium]|nr:hypothetical protein [Terriglobales bacterium]